MISVGGYIFIGGGCARRYRGDLKKKFGSQRDPATEAEWNGVLLKQSKSARENDVSGMRLLHILTNVLFLF